MMVKPTVVWFRQDLRLSDNPALSAAVKRGGPVLPVFIWAPQEEAQWAPGSASRWWLHQSLRSLAEHLNERGSRLILRQDDSFQQLQNIVAESDADAVFWNRRYEPAVFERDTHIQAVLSTSGLQVETFNASLLFEPWDVKTGQGRPYQVFTPFWKACQSLDVSSSPGRVPRRLSALQKWPRSESLESLRLEPEVDWAGGLRKRWRPGEDGAKKQLRRFLAKGLATYQSDRDFPDRSGTSSLSPHLHFGEISPQTIWHAVHKAARQSSELAPGAEAFLRELGWREFAHHVLFHFPNTSDHPLRPQFEHFPWTRDLQALRSWQRGQTGYPIVDAGMRELWTTGWMHNRVRMIVGSFLTKDLRISWQDGACWFWDTLVDADLANNTLGWQWVSGCGADAAPYFRVFNPVAQGEKFDPEGGYVRRWVPELKEMPNRWIHQPWQAPADVLESAGIYLGRTYPYPMVDHAEAREQALSAFNSIKAR